MRCRDEDFQRDKTGVGRHNRHVPPYRQGMQDLGGQRSREQIDTIDPYRYIVERAPAGASATAEGESTRAMLIVCAVE